MHHAPHATILSLLATIVLHGCVSASGAQPVESRAAPAGGAGYLAPDAIPNSAVLSPPPPAAGSVGQALDDAISRKYLLLQGSPRFKQAALDAQFKFTFDCALNAPISKAQTPILYGLLEKTVVDAGMSTAAAKDLYQRPRPFMVNRLPTCLPGQDKTLRENGSYPSGHSSVGWAFALILAELAPEQATALFARGRSFAQSRAVCNVHWYSDTVEGMILASAAVARLHADPKFVADMARARSELAAVRAKGIAVTADCAAQADALKE